MADYPKRVRINEEGPREGFQFEKGPIATADKIALIDALSEARLPQIQVCSFVNPARVPGMADADEVVAGITRKPGTAYTALWLNEKGFDRALAAGRLDLKGSISMVASETFMKRNQNRDFAENHRVQMHMVRRYLDAGLTVERASMMAAFGCNFEGEVPVARVLDVIAETLEIAEACGVAIRTYSLADTMAWATPASVQRVVGAVRERWPDLNVALHLHDTRGMGIANAFAGLQMGVDTFDASVAGLGGCPFAGHRAAAGNVCSEDLAFLCEEMGIETGIDLDALSEAARLAERVVGHALPGSVMKAGRLSGYRSAA
ncbi:hydroxymethylglutaryl-CoA lyase [Acuticoccus sediminis]|uniref:Hydroxymethylglutaryl-CoA lyase n=1 Tax=Acuticoccus sediminis TaxID=2184697 RepID=A0A8B2NWI9_9HYPH|nr:hydroxymethylglutaryl-CoA lyase [Acuticoccus sediminis]RAI01884.1 hydroxymethylglutaryl-CoA lyase [Acuticoccus sediminis]